MDQSNIGVNGDARLVIRNCKGDDIGGGLHKMYPQGWSQEINKIHKELIPKMEYMNWITGCMKVCIC